MSMALSPQHSTIHSTTFYCRFSSVILPSRFILHGSVLVPSSARECATQKHTRVSERDDDSARKDTHKKRERFPCTY